MAYGHTWKNKKGIWGWICLINGKVIGLIICILYNTTLKVTDSLWFHFQPLFVRVGLFIDWRVEKIIGQTHGSFLLVKEYLAPIFNHASQEITYDLVYVCFPQLPNVHHQNKERVRTRVWNGKGVIRVLKKHVLIQMIFKNHLVTLNLKVISNHLKSISV